MNPQHPNHLSRDLDHLNSHLQQRRRTLRWLAAGACASGAPLALMACGGGDLVADDSAVTTSGTNASGTTCTTIPTETAGPYPGDGSNGSSNGQRINALLLSGIVRSDIRSSVGGASGTALGVPLTVTLNLVNASASCTGLAGHAVYLWHCTRDGGYSMYSGGLTGENFLRGVQVSDGNGQVTFTTIFPGCYAGRWPHIHFEIYPSLGAAIDNSAVGDHSKVSQLALPASACEQVYGVKAGYSASVANFSRISLNSDNVFGDDGAARQIPDMTGNANTGFAATLQVALSA
jgi:protocatechuate 3,4-dioxygenase beta subunit